MRRPRPKRILPLAAGCAMLALVLSGCASAVSTSDFLGEARVVAQTIANLQSDVTGANYKNVCTKDLAETIVTSLGGQKGCEAAIKRQLTDVDSLEASIVGKSVSVSGNTASARVESVYEGHKRRSTIELVKEGGVWKVSALK